MTPGQIIAAFAGDLVVAAGAGTGKTHALTDLYLRLLAGVTQLGRVAPARICALTFTDKAAGEMRTRLGARIADAMAGNDHALLAAYREAGAPPLSALEWEQRLHELGSAPISTFHAFAATVVRAAAAELGVDPAFQLIDERAAGSLIGEVIEAALPRALERSELTHLIGELELERARGGGLLASLQQLVGQLAEQDLERPALAIDAGAARAALLAAMAEVRATVTTMLAETARSLKPADRERREAAQRGLAGLTRFERSLGIGLDLAQDPAAAVVADSSDRLARAATELATTHVDLKTAGFKARDGWSAVRNANEKLHAAWGDVASGPQLAALAQLVGEVRRSYQVAKATRGVLDFADLMNGLSRLAQGPGREALARGFDAVLVDEYQDSSRIQGALIDALTSAGARRFLVGDRKQSIYDFRGADVGVFTAAERAVVASGGQRVVLRENRRSRPGLLAFVRALFQPAMQRAEHDFDVRYGADDELTAHRAAGVGPAVELLEPTLGEDDLTSPERRRCEARAVARRIAALVAPAPAPTRGASPTAAPGGVMIEPRGGGPERPARYGDIALLLARFSHLDVYLAELRRLQIPYYVVKGRGFFEAQEVRDLAAALAVLVDPDDTMALLTVLRSPLVALSDVSLVQLAAGRPLRLEAVRQAALTGTPALPEAEARRLGRWVTVHDELVGALDRLGPGGALRALIAALDLEAVLAAGFHGEQRLANLARLLDLADAAGPGAGGARRFVRELDADVEAQAVAPAAQVLAEGDDVVRVMTVHQSKGLEFGVVFVPDCAAQSPSFGNDVAYDRDLGLALRTRLGWESASWTAVSKRLQRREAAQSLRLFYVATTRARELLVLSGAKRRHKTACWRLLLDDMMKGPDRELVKIVNEDELPPGLPAREASAAEQLPELETGAPLAGDSALLGRDLADVAEARAAVARALAPRPRPATLVTSVTALADFQRCARRYQYRPELGLEEHPRPEDAGADADELSGEDVAGWGDADPDAARGGHGAIARAGWPPEGLGARGRGALAHRVLELCDLELAARAPEAAVDAALEQAGAERASAEELARVRADVLRWLGSAGARKLLLARPAAVRREEPFALVVGDTPRVLLKGQIDVLVDDSEAVVLDYKHSRSRSGRDHGFQLLAYALAAQQLLGKQRVRVGLCWLGDGDPTPALSAPSEANLEDFRVELATLGGALADARARDRFAGVERPRCEALKCGYVGRCWPGG
ncbi:MAG: UvrD-helicase domain-containing protein [Deltaproteobacteria bacterium]|nr:UvrD-helicase domain-containing protein [Deltaproteobacteria bacterium]